MNHPKAAARGVRGLAVWLLAAMSLAGPSFAGCSEDRTLPSYARLNRSNAVDFACVEDQKVVPTSLCRPNPAVVSTRKLYAFVSQSARGEVATIDLGTRELLDSRVDIPGYTFVPVGEGPVSIVVPPNHPTHTYVANFGSRDIYVFDTTSLVPPAVSTAPVQIIPLSGAGTDGTHAAAPTQMILDPTGDESALLVAAPELGRVLRIPIRRNCPADQAGCSDGLLDGTSITSVDLRGSATLAPASDPPASGDARYEALCDFTRPVPPPAQPIVLDAADMKAAPRPRAMTVDAFCRPDEAACKPRLLVADDALPVLHVIDLTAFGGANPGAALLAPIAVGTPTRDVAVTPRVPIALGSDQETQYIYAIDATDGSVLVVEGSRVVNVNSFPNPRANRIELPNTDGTGAANAATLAVLTPDFDPTLPSSTQYLKRLDVSGPLPEGANPDEYCPQPDRDIQDATLLRGVFVAIALSDGKVRLVDVHDMTLRTPDGSRACRLCPSASIPLLARHHLRLSLNLEGIEAPAILPATQTLSWIGGSQQYSIREDGTSGSPDAPSLECLSCGSLQPVFPRTDSPTTSDAVHGAACTPEGPSLLCSMIDPWSALEEPWSATFEGSIPGAIGGGGVIAAPGSAANKTGGPELLARVDFCAAGVLGNEDIGAAYAADDCDDSVKAAANATPPPGDQVSITSPLIDSAGPECAAARQALTDDPALVLSLPIRRAYRDRLVLGSLDSLEGVPEALKPLGNLDTLQRCLGGAPIAFSVRTRDAFTIVGVQSGFRHGVIGNGAGRCVVDPATQATGHGRARRGCTFQNGAFAFRLRPAGATEQRLSVGLEWYLRLQSPVPRLYFDGNYLGSSLGQAHVLPVQLRYLAPLRWLYLVDIHERGLVPIPAGDAPFPQAIDATLTVN